MAYLTHQDLDFLVTVHYLYLGYITLKSPSIVMLAAQSLSIGISTQMIRGND